MSKVYCSECRHYSSSSDPFEGWDTGEETCTSPSNLQGTYLSPKQIPIYTCEKRNRDNKCAWFSKRR